MRLIRESRPRATKRFPWNSPPPLRLSASHDGHRPRHLADDQRRGPDNRLLDPHDRTPRPAKKLEQRLRPQAGSPPVAVYNPDDVAVQAAERQRAAPPFVLGAVQASGNGHGPSLKETPGSFPETLALTLPPGDDPIARFFARLCSHLQSPPSPPVSPSVSETAYVPKAEALAIAGVSDGELRKAVRAGEVKRRGRRYRRQDLEAL